MKTNKILLSIGLSLLLLGCNSSNNDKKSDTPQAEKVSVPKNIDMKVPKALTKEGTSQKRLQKIEALESAQSRGYTQLKDEIANAEEERKVVQVNLLLADKLMPKIQDLCVDIPIFQTCEIGEGELTFVLDSAMRTDIGNIMGETLPTDTPDKEMSLGETTFTIYPDSKDYKYVLTMDMSPMIRRDVTDTTVYLQTLKWSKDEKRVWSIYKTGDNATMSLRYTKNANGQTQMEIDDNSKLSGDAISEGLNTASVSTSTSIPIDGNASVINLGNDTPSIQSMEEQFDFKVTN